MIKLLNKEFLGTLRENSISFLLTFEIKHLTKEEVSKIDAKFKTKFCIKENCYFYSEIYYDEEVSKAIITIMIYLTTFEWPNDRYEQDKLIYEYAINVQKIIEKILNNNSISKN